MRISLRPCKITLFKRLESDLRGLEGEVGLDAASAAFKSYPYFRTKTYYGVDIDKSALQQGVRDHPGTIGLLGDVTDLELPSRSVDVCVSTNTLNWFARPDRLRALQELARVVAPQGWLVVGLDNDEFMPEALALLRERFEVVEVSYYSNRICQLYEGWLLRRVNVHRRARGLMGRALLGMARVVSFSDTMSASPAGRDQAYVRCHRRRDGGDRAEFVIDESQRIADGIYSLDGASAGRPAAQPAIDEGAVVPRALAIES